jgi:hypothetical protein
VRVEPHSLGDVLCNGHVEEFQQWAPNVVIERLGVNRCASLMYGTWTFSWFRVPWWAWWTTWRVMVMPEAKLRSDFLLSYRRRGSTARPRFGDGVRALFDSPADL